MINKSVSLPNYEEIISNFDKKFTNREIDILACLICGRAASIPAFFSISGRTVEKHIQNIKNKLECCSREQILDYAEKSTNYIALKLHYQNLIVYNKFQSCLNKIKKIEKVDTTILFTIDNSISTGESHHRFINEIQKNLLDVGLNTKKNLYINKNDGYTSTGTEKIIVKLHAASNFFEISSLNINEIDIIIFFGKILDEEKYLELKNRYINTTFINFFNYSSYYEGFFLLLERLVPTLQLEEYLNEFDAKNNKMSNILNEEQFNKIENNMFHSTVDEFECEMPKLIDTPDLKKTM